MDFRLCGKIPGVESMSLKKGWFSDSALEKDMTILQGCIYFLWAVIADFFYHVSDKKLSLSFTVVMSIAGDSRDGVEKAFRLSCQERRILSSLTNME